MSSHDVKCRFCGEVTGINYDVCQECAETIEARGEWHDKDDAPAVIFSNDRPIEDIPF